MVHYCWFLFTSTYTLVTELNCRTWLITPSILYVCASVWWLDRPTQTQWLLTSYYTTAVDLLSNWLYNHLYGLYNDSINSVFLIGIMFTFCSFSPLLLALPRQPPLFISLLGHSHAHRISYFTSCVRMIGVRSNSALSADIMGRPFVQW